MQINIDCSYICIEIQEITVEIQEYIHMRLCPVFTQKNEEFKSERKQGGDL